MRQGKTYSIANLKRNADESQAAVFIQRIPSYVPDTANASRPTNSYVPGTANATRPTNSHVPGAANASRPTYTLDDTVHGLSSLPIPTNKPGSTIHPIPAIPSSMANYIVSVIREIPVHDRATEHAASKSHVYVPTAPPPIHEPVQPARSVCSISVYIESRPSIYTGSIQSSTRISAQR